MTVLPDAAASRHLVAECCCCGLRCQTLAGQGDAAALRAFRVQHPLTASVPHGRGVPDGWRLVERGESPT